MDSSVSVTCLGGGILEQTRNKIDCAFVELRKAIHNLSAQY